MLCGHCGKMLTLKTYRRHRKLYYQSETDEWITAEVLFPSVGLWAAIAYVSDLPYNIGCSPSMLISVQTL